MSTNDLGPSEPRSSSRIWRFAYCDFDESSRQLRVHDELVDIESKPLDVLQQLLQHAGEVLTKDELLEAVWPGLAVVEGSLATAVSKLRKALGDDEQSLILTVPRVGYRLAGPVQVRQVTPPPLPELGFKEGDRVPGRDQWQLAQKLDVSLSSEVWRADHLKTGESRVFKFAADGIRLRGLKREVTLARVLTESLGERPEFVRVLEWNFDVLPYYLESEFGGQNLADWAESQGGLDRIPMETRLAVVTDVARAVALAHEVGVLHKDLKPANILIAPRPDGSWQVRVADFGSGALVEPARLGELGITNLGFTASEHPDTNPLTGTLMYLAPEVLAGQAPTALADVYALGVILYQVVTGDFRTPLSPSWEAGVADPLLREDIADAACGDPKRRLATVAALVDRLTSLAQRRTAKSELEAARQRAQAAEQRLAQARARRPWVIIAAALLIAGLGVSLTLYRNATVERNRANRQSEIAAAMNRFLADDLLGRSNPFQSGSSTETLADSIQAAIADIDRQFENAPEVAARLHQSIAKALDNRSDFPPARQEYERAAALFVAADGEDSAGAVVVRLQQAAMEARTYAEGSVPKAQQLLADAEARLPRLQNPPADLPVWQASARGMIALINNDARQAAEQFGIAYEKSRTLPGFDEMAQLTFKQRLAFSNIRLGDGPRAEQLFRELISDFTRVQGPDNPSALRVRLNLAQAFMIQNKHADAVAETSAIYPLYVQKLGEDHELSMQVLTTQAESEGALGRWDDAIRDDLKIHELAVKKQGPTSFFAIATESDASLAMCRAGHLREGAAHASNAYQTSLKAFGLAAGLTGGVGHTLATCWISLGNLDDAARVLQGIDASAVAQLAGSKDWGANVELSWAEIAYRRADYAEARKRLEAAAPLGQSGAEPYQRRELEELTAAVDQKLSRN